MTDDPHEQLEQRLHASARSFRYPPTPDLVALLRDRRSRQQPVRVVSPAVWLLVVVALLGAMLLATPQVRAAVLEVLRIGVVRIVPAATALPATPGLPSVSPLATATPFSAATATRPVADPLRQLHGATTLEQAQARLPFALKQPGEPADLGPPDAVFVQNLGGPAAILVWREPRDPSQLRLALYILSDDVFAQKLGVTVIKETSVNGRRAVWASGPYFLQIGEGNRSELAERRLVSGNTLIWEDGELTYRLESNLPLEEAIQIAESLR